jgi:hypothetical protein
MGEVSTIGLDIAKSVFQVHGVNVDGTVVIRKRTQSGHRRHAPLMSANDPKRLLCPTHRCLLLARSGHQSMSALTSAFGGKADSLCSL